MIIEIKIFSFLLDDTTVSENRLEGDQWNIPDGANVAHVLKMLNLADEQKKTFLVNGRHADEETVLNEGDVLHIYPPITGG